MNTRPAPITENDLSKFELKTLGKLAIIIALFLMIIPIIIYSCSIKSENEKLVLSKLQESGFSKILISKHVLHDFDGYNGFVTINAFSSSKELEVITFCYRRINTEIFIKKGCNVSTI